MRNRVFFNMQLMRKNHDTIIDKRIIILRKNILYYNFSTTNKENNSSFDTERATHEL